MELFVDVTYLGLEVGRRIKLTEVAPDTGYLEVAAPMPVGTTVVLAIEGGLAITAIVRGVHEQVSGGDHPPGMRIAPKLDGVAAAWWAERVTLSVAPPARRTHEMSAAEADSARVVAERVRQDSGAPPFVQGRKTREVPDGEIKAAVAAAHKADQKLGLPRAGLVTPVDGTPVAVLDEDGLVDDGRKTEVMAAVDPDILARLTGTGDLPLVDDGKRTVMMAVPPVMDGDDDGDDSGDDNGDGDGDAGNGGDEAAPSASDKLPAARGKRKGRRNKRR